MSGALAPLRSRAVAVGALVRRDLSSGRRGATVASARLVVACLTGVVAVAALANAQLLYGHPAEAGLAGWTLIWLLAGFSLLLLPVLSLQAMRQDRTTGTLELLLLAGLSPRLLAVGRWLSTFLLLESLLLDALPAMTAFVFFGSPTPGELAWGALALTGWNASLAGLAVFLSTSIRRAGPALFASILTMTAIAGGSAWGLAAQTGGKIDSPPAAPMLLFELTAFRQDPRSVPPLQPLRHLAGLATFAGLGALLALLAGERLSAQARPGSATGSSRRRWWARLRDRGGLGAPGRLPLTWLLHRGAPATRPLTLALVLPIPLFAFTVGFLLRQRGDSSLTWADLLASESILWVASIFCVIGLLLALLAPALQIGRLRERREWQSLLATGRSGRALVLDLLAGPAAAAGVTLSLSLVLLAGAAVNLQGSTRAPTWGDFAAAAAMIGGAALFLLSLSLLAGLAARSAAGALGLALLLLLSALTLGGLSTAWLAQTALGLGLDWESRLSAIALAAACVVPLQLLLLSRSRRKPGAGRLFFDLLLCSSLLTPPLWLGLDQAGSGTEEMLMVALATAALGLPLLVVALRRPDHWLGRAG